MNELPHQTFAIKIAFDMAVLHLCALHSCSVTSGARTEKRNAAVGGHPNSWHRLERGGVAADIVPDTNTESKRTEVARAARRLGLHAVVEESHVHLQPLPPWPSGAGA